MLTIESASNPKYTAQDNSGIELLVKFKEFTQPIPFNATPNDIMSYGVELYNRAKAGEFGDISPYIATLIPAQDQPITTGTQAA
jgi:hypothetical protein